MARQARAGGAGSRAAGGAPVSLLLDALKRAEQEKLARGERPDLQIVSPAEGAPAQATAPAPGQRERDRDAAAAAHRASLELQPIGQPATATPAAKAPSAAAAQVVFQAKLPPGGAQDKPRRGWMYASLGAIVIAVIAAGAYVWYVMQQLAPTPIPARRMAGPMAPSAPVPQLPSPGFPQSAPSRSTPVPAAEAGLPPPSFSAPTAMVTPVPKGPAPAAAPSAPARAAAPSAPPAAPTREQAAAELLRQAPAQREAPPLLDRAPQGPRIPAQVSAGYEALRNADLAGARRAYEAAIVADASNVDALLGMATVEARGGNIAAAGAAYRKALELDPRNPTALAGLATLADPSRRGTVEARLREDVMRYPQSPALHFALGNVYSAQSRWSEAQGEYFEAHRLDPSNADIAHNLAVALDNLGQSRVAAQFYRRALDAARTQPAQFDPAPASRRLAELGN
jgi:tetratricopeptide (TPR) repeat protein